MQGASTFSSGTAVINPTSTIEISVSCRNLLDKDLLSKSDPVCVIFHKPLGSNHWVELMRTETIQNNLNPEFFKKLTTEYRFEEQQLLKFELYDVDSPSSNLADHDFLGYAETTIATIVSSGTSGLSLPLLSRSQQGGFPPRRSHGTIILIAEELEALKDEVTFKFGGSSIGQMSCCIFPPKVFYTVSKVNESSIYVLAHRSETVNGQDPTWREFTMSVRNLCNGDLERGLKIECFEEKYSGSHKLIGSLATNLKQLVDMGSGGGLKLVGPGGRETSSTFLIIHCKVTKVFTFVDYIQNGTKIHCCFAIDFTSSNGDPSDPTSLHHFSDGVNMTNPYEQAISSVGTIIQDYDETKMFPVMGFGAKVPPPPGKVSHNFNVTLNDSPYCYGIPGVLEAYRNCIRQIQMYGPTNFSPVINHVARIASNSRVGEDYYVLLIITDGIITDMANTKEAIVSASSLPLSIIIVGVGGADFSAMEELDGDAVRLSSNGRFAERDIVQFVPYRDAYSWMSSSVGGGFAQQQGHGYGMQMPMPYEDRQGGATHMAQIKLAQEVLQEIPEQLTSYMKSKRIRPLGMKASP